MADDTYPSTDEALAAKIAEVREAIRLGEDPWPAKSQRPYLEQLQAEQRRRKGGRS